jgi:hypothetical protein
MSQILNIFRKDARHHWPEILLSWALVAVYVWDQPRKWANQTIHIRFVAGLLNILPALMILCWAFLIARVVQGESLVGDRQFWITRPYEWHKLFAAKLLAIVAFIHIPLFVGQIVLLKLGNFPVASSLKGLVEIHLLFVTIFLAGALAIAVVTSGIGQASLALLILFFMILGIAGISSLVPNSSVSDDTDGVQGILYIACCITVVLVQYIRRKTLVSRFIILGTIVLIVLVIVFAPYETIFRHNYPLPTKEHPLPAKFTFDRALTFAHEQRPPSKWVEDEISLELPLQVADLNSESLVQIQAIRLDLELTGRKRWTSHWHSVSNVVSYGRTRTWPSISIETKFYDGIKNTPVKASLSLGMRSFRLGAVTTITVAGDRTSLPGNARCVDNLSDNWLQCFSALRRPKPIFIMAELPNRDCQVSKEATANEPWANSPATYYDLASDTGPDFDLSPIQNFSIGLSRYHFFEDLDTRLPVCSGTRLLVSKPELQYAVRDEIDLGEITLANYHPTYPRKIIPPARRPMPGETRDSLSRNIGPEFLPVKLEYSRE